MWQHVQTRGGGTSAYYQVVKGLTSDTTHTFQVRAATADAKGALATVTATPLRGRAAGRALLGAWGLPDPTALTDLRAALLGSSFLYAGAQDADGPRRGGRQHPDGAAPLRGL